MNKNKQKLDRIFSEYIRRRDADSNGIVRCVTCGKWVHWKQADCGHFISRRFESTRYDEKNTAGQCRFCNRFNQGKQYEYGLKIDDMYGRGTAEGLLQKSKMTCKRVNSDYLFLIEEYKQKIKEL